MADSSTSSSAAVDHAVGTILRVCQLAGSPTMLSDLRAELKSFGVAAAVARHDTATLFDWLMTALSFQGIADRVAEGFIRDNGNIEWRDIATALSRNPSCSKLESYWQYYDCLYHKGLQMCSERFLFNSCPLPRHKLRNG